LFLVKTVSLVLGVSLITLAVYWAMGLLIVAALIIAVAGLYIEIEIRRRQKPYLVTLADIERTLDLPTIYLKIERKYLKDFYVLFPHVAIVGLAIITAGLWLLERLP
jgi:hypothetical protein